MVTNARFIADPPAARPSVMFEGLTVVFHRPSGMTHILATPAPEILSALGKGAANAREIVERLGERHQLADLADAEAIVTARLAELEAAGLVERS